MQKRRGRGRSSCSSRAIRPSSRSSISWDFPRGNASRDGCPRTAGAATRIKKGGLCPADFEARCGAPGYERRGAEARRRRSRGEVRGLGLQLARNLHRRWRAGADAEKETGAGANALPEGAHPITRTDRGVRCRRGGWIGLMDGHGLARSMPRKACRPDNAADEEFSGPLKVEMHHGAGWERRAAAELEAELAEHMDRYNRERIEVSLSSMSPYNYRKSLGSQHDGPFQITSAFPYLFDSTVRPTLQFDRYNTLSLRPLEQSKVRTGERG